MTDSSVPYSGGGRSRGSQQATSPSLLERARHHDGSAWDRIVYLYSPLIYRWCEQFGLQEADMLDVGQEVLRAVFTHLGNFRKENSKDSFRKWLKTITRNQARSFLRRMHRQPMARGGEWAPAANTEPLDEDAAEQVSEQKLLLRRALDVVRSEFEPQTWNRFWKVTIEETPPKVVAEMENVGLNLVHLACSRVLRRLAEQFSELIEGWQTD